MKLFGYRCHTEDVLTYVTWIKDEVGATVYKIQDIDFTKRSIILFIVPDDEFEMMLTLKYPPDTFVKPHA